MTTPTRPKRFEEGQRWRWLKVYERGKEFVVASVSRIGGACIESGQCVACAERLDEPENLEYLGMASGEGEGPTMGERYEFHGVFPVGCLQCGATLKTSEAYECHPCPTAGYEERTDAWRAGARDFPRKPKAAPVYHLPTGPAVIPAPPSTVAPPGSLGWLDVWLPGVAQLPRIYLGDGGSMPLPPPAPKPVRIEVASDPAGRTRIDYRLLLDPEPVERYRWRWFDGTIDLACPGARAKVEVAIMGLLMKADAEMAAAMAREGYTNIPPPAPAPYVCAVSDADLLPDADEPICPPRARGMRKPGALR